VDIGASATNGLGGWRLGVPVTPYRETQIIWSLERELTIGGKAVALDGKTPHASLVVELVHPAEGDSRAGNTSSAAVRRERERETSAEPTQAPGRSGFGGSLTLPPAAGSRALHLPKEGSYTKLPGGIFDTLDKTTIECWVQWHEERQDVLVFVYGRDEWLNLAFGMFARTSLGAAITTSRNSSFPNAAIATDVLRTNEWTHVGFVAGPGGQRLDVNGVLFATNAFTGSFAATPKGLINWIGRWPGTRGLADQRNTIGQIAEFRVWKTPRTAEQIRASMFRRLTGTEPGLAGLWNFEDPAMPARDATPAANHGRLMGQAVITNVAIPAALVFGRITDVSGTPVPGASVEVRSATGKERRVLANAAGEYAFPLDAPEPFDVFVTTGELSAYQLGLRPNGEPQQRLDWTLADPERTPVVLGSSSVGIQAVAGAAAQASRPAGDSITRPAEAGTPNAAFAFPAGTVAASARSAGRATSSSQM
jgi:hypothetical protein